MSRAASRSVERTLYVSEAAATAAFQATGEATPGSLSFRRGATGEFLWQLRWDLLGRIEVTDDPLEAGDA